jgi:hypothetical protein
VRVRRFLKEAVSRYFKREGTEEALEVYLKSQTKR